MLYGSVELAVMARVPSLAVELLEGALCCEPQENTRRSTIFICTGPICGSCFPFHGLGAEGDAMVTSTGEC